MKKIIAITIVLLLSVALFADGVITANLGGAFSLVSAKNPHSAMNKPTDVDSNILADYDLTLEKAAGFGFNVGFDFKLSTDYNLYMDFSMTFPSTVTVGDYEATRSERNDYYNELKELYEEIDFTSIVGKAFMNNLEIHIGFSKNIDINSKSFAFRVGGGLGYRRIKSGIQFTARKTEEGATLFYCYDEFETLAHVSFDVYANASYKLSDQFSVGVTLMPGVTFYSASKFYATKKGTNLEPIPSTDYYGGEENSGMKPKYENSGFAAGFSLAARIGVSYTF